MLLGAVSVQSFYMDMFSVLLGKYLGTELLGDMVTLRLLF